MRTTVDLDSDVLSAARELARRRRQSLGRVLSDLARTALTKAEATAQEPETPFYGFAPFPADGRVADNDTVERLREEDGI